MIIGGGVAGLCCARALEQANHDWLLIEASDRLGGRVATDYNDGFVTDRGFQVLLTSYPEVQKQLDLPALNLKAYASGARVWVSSQPVGKWHIIADPRRHPMHCLHAFSFPHLGIHEIAATLRWLWRSRKPLKSADWDNVTSTAAHLRSLGYRDAFIKAFWQPFLSGVFLDPSLSRPSAWADYVFRAFASGSAAIPANGIAAIVNQLANGLPQSKILLNSTVVSVDGESIKLANGSSIHAHNRVLTSVDEHLRRILGIRGPEDFLGTQYDVFIIPKLPVHASFLHLIADPRPYTVTFPTALHPQMAPDGLHLACVSQALGRTSHSVAPVSPESILQDLTPLWPCIPRPWRHLKQYVIPKALPMRNRLIPSHFEEVPKLPRTWIIGDHQSLPSLNSAMESGRRIAKKLAVI